MVGAFDGKVVIVTGGALGIGGATARECSREGASVVIADFDADCGHSNCPLV